MPAGYGKGGYDGSGTKGGLDSGISISPGEAPAQEPEKQKGIVQKAVNVVKGLFTAAGKKSKQQYSIKNNEVKASKNFFNKIQAYKIC